MALPINRDVSPALNRRQLTQLKNDLEQERRWLTGMSAQDWLTLANAAGTHASSGTRMHRQLQQVLEALDRMENGTYGMCLQCRSPIPFERLEAVPETATCIGCGRV